MKRKLATLAITTGIMLSLVGCGTQSDKVSYNLSQEADNFNVVRQVV